MGEALRCFEGFFFPTQSRRRCLSRATRLSRDARSSSVLMRPTARTKVFACVLGSTVLQFCTSLRRTLKDSSVEAPTVLALPGSKSRPMRLSMVALLPASPRPTTRSLARSHAWVSPSFEARLFKLGTYSGFGSTKLIAYCIIYTLALLGAT